MHVISDSSIIFSVKKADDFSSVLIDSRTTSFEELNVGLSKLAQGKAVAIVSPINLLPINQKDNNWTIAALLPRNEVTVKACFTKNNPTNGEALWLKPNALIHCNSNNILTQVKMWHPQVRPVAREDAETFFYLESQDQIKGEVLSIPPAEIVPDTGHGILAIVTLKTNLDLRRKLAELHHRPTAFLSNVERQATSLIQDKFTEQSLHCTKDKLGRYHLYGFTKSRGKSKKYHILQHSWVGLADNFLKEFNKKES